jgi:hypothetical protein
MRNGALGEGRRESKFCLARIKLLTIAGSLRPVPDLSGTIAWSLQPVPIYREPLTVRRTFGPGWERQPGAGGALRERTRAGDQRKPRRTACERGHRHALG